MSALEITFVILAAIVFYTYIGYGILLFICVRIKEFFVKSVSFNLTTDDNLPEVSFVIAAYNEEEIIDEKMSNCNSLDYPSQKLKIVWVTDGSNDNSVNLLSKYPGVNILHSPERKGKTAAINRAMRFIESPLVIFTDANTMVNSSAVREIVSCYSNPKVGCVAGEKRIAVRQKDVASSSGEGIYWKYESFLKKYDSRLYSAVGAAGELFSIRRELFTEMETDTLLDDFVMSMKIAQQGYKIEYCSSAYAYETGSENIEEEKKRKVRISAGGLQSIWRLRALLNVFRTPVLSFQYISHRVLRWTVTPLALFALLPLNVLIVLMNPVSTGFIILLLLQICFYIMGFAGKVLADKKVKNKVLFVPYYFLFMNINVIFGLFYLIRKSKGDGTWEKSKRQSKIS